MNDNLIKASIVHQVSIVGKEEAKQIIDKAKIDDGDDIVFINELERIYNEK